MSIEVARMQIRGAADVLPRAEAEADARTVVEKLWFYKVS